jgi:hypothetical protein
MKNIVLLLGILVLSAFCWGQDLLVPLTDNNCVQNGPFGATLYGVWSNMSCATPSLASGQAWHTGGQTCDEPYLMETDHRCDKTCCSWENVSPQPDIDVLITSGGACSAEADTVLWIFVHEHD